jgi:hypothetical protein
VKNSRLLQLLVAAAVAAVAVWIAMHTYWDYDTVDNPPQGEAARNRFYAFERLAQRFSIQTQEVSALRTPPATDKVLFIDDLRAAALPIDALEKWIVDGGRLLLSGRALLSSPKLQSWSEIGRASPRPEDEDGAAGAPPPPASPQHDCPPYVERLAGRESGRSLRACLGPVPTAFSSLRVPAWSLSNGYGFRMLRVRIGKGSITVIPCECLIVNDSILRADHARIVFDAIPLRVGDQMAIFNPKDAEGLPAMLWRLAPAAIICSLAAVGLTIWRNLPRLGRIAPLAPPQRRSLAEQIRASARFAWRTGHLASLRQAERQAVTLSASQKLAFYERMEFSQRIAALAAHTGLDSDSLRDALSETLDGGAEAQRTAINLLETARRR